MAATGKTPILLYGSTTPTNAPAAGNLTNSSDGCEIAINVADKNLFFKDSTNAVNTVPIRQSSASSNGWLSSTDWSTFNGKAPAFTYTTNYIPFGQGTTTPTESSLFTYTSGNLLLGTTTNSARLSIGVNSANADGIYALNANNSSYFSLYACGATGYGVTDWANSTLLEAVPASGGNLVLGSYSGSVVIQTGARAKSSRFFASGGVSIGNTTDPGATNLRVEGVVSIGGAAISNEKLGVAGSVASFISRMYNYNASPSGSLVYYAAAAPNGTGNQFYWGGDTGATRFEVRSNGGIANYQANDANLSDIREKTDIELAGSYLYKICSIPVKTFKYIDQSDDEKTIGVIAQDVQKICPELVQESNWAKENEQEKMRLSIYQTDLQYALMKALQELKAEFDDYVAKHS